MVKGLLDSLRVIATFDKEYAFLSNTYCHRHPINETLGSVTLRYPTVAHAVYGMHLTCLTDKIHASKTHISRIPQLESVDPEILLGCLRQKFRCPELRRRLLATGNVRLKGATGQTRALLEQVREEVRSECSTTRNSKRYLGIPASITS